MNMMVACAWCGRVKLDDWVEPEEAIRAMRSYERPESPRFSHGICTDCFDEVAARRQAAAEGAVA